MKENNLNFVTWSNNQKIKHLFWQSLKISGLTFGGGYVIFSFLKKHYVDELGIVTEDDMLSYLSLAQSAPGPVAINISILLGNNLAGFKGALAALLGTVLPPLFFLTALYYLFSLISQLLFISYLMQGLRIAVTAEMCIVVYSLLNKYIINKDYFSLALTAICLLLAVALKVHILVILFSAALLGLLLGYLPTLRNYLAGKDGK